jgi:hypothetical protein
MLKPGYIQNGVSNMASSQRKERENAIINQASTQKSTKCPQMSSFPILQWRLIILDGHEQLDLVRRQDQTEKMY